MSVALPLLFLAAGGAAGTIHFAGLWHETRLFATGGPLLRIGALRFGRTALTIATLLAAALQGWPALLAAAAGFMAARRIMVRRLGEAA